MPNDWRALTGEWDQPVVYRARTNRKITKKRTKKKNVNVDISFNVIVIASYNSTLIFSLEVDASPIFSAVAESIRFCYI